MLFVVVGIIMVGLKALSLVDYLNELSWWWCLAPFIAAFIYWEIIEKAFGINVKMERRRQRKDAEKRRKQQMHDLDVVELADKKEQAKSSGRHR